MLAEMIRTQVMPDVRLIALADVLLDESSRYCRRDPSHANVLITTAADMYALAFGYNGALAVPAGARLPVRIRRCIRRAAGDDDAADRA